MNRKFVLALAVLIPTAIAAAPREASAQRAIIWDDMGAGANGTGCPDPSDTLFLEFNNDVAVIFNGFDINLHAGENALKNCSVAIPATIRQGFYSSRLTQILSYGINKSEGGTATISSRSAFFNRRVSSFNVPIGGAARMGSFSAGPLVDNFIVFDSCAGDLSGLFRSNLQIAGSQPRLPRDGFLILATEALDVRFDITADIFLCPLP